MKTTLKSVFAIALTAFAFSSCEDVPEPYEIPGGNGGGGTSTNDSIYINETFASSFGDFTAVTPTGTAWTIDFSTAKATGYDNTSKVTTASEGWLVSNPVDLSKSNGAYLQFDYILRYVSANAENKVMVSTDYSGDPSTATWTDITGTLTEGTDWSTFAKYATNLPASVIGQSNVVVALYYKCNATNSSTWEVKNLILKEGKVDASPATDGYLNETFGSSFGDFTAVTPTGTAWTIDFSTAKATGYDNTSKVTTASEGWLVSKSVDLSASTGAYLQFDYILRYVSANAENKVMVSTNYAGDPSTATWTDITGTLTEGTDWSTFAKYATNLPASVIGQSNVVVALYYKCNSTNSSTWEVKNLILKEGKVDTPPASEDYLNETFGSSFGDFTAVTPTGTAWTIDYSTAKATGWDGSTTTASEGWLVSKPVDLSASTGAYLQFSYILRYVAAGITENKVMVSTNYTGDPSTATWTDITGTLTEGSDWSTFSTYATDLPASVIEQSNVVVALYYKCSTSSATWEVKNLTLKEGKANNGGGGSSTSDITLTLSALGLENATELSSNTLSDGTVITFSVGSGSTTPKYYTTGTAGRFYPNNTITVSSSSKKIASVVLNCVSSYLGNNPLTATADGTPTTATQNATANTVSVSSLDCNSVVFENTWSTNSGGTQLRITSIEITYVK